MNTTNYQSNHYKKVYKTVTVKFYFHNRKLGGKEYVFGMLPSQAKYLTAGKDVLIINNVNKKQYVLVTKIDVVDESQWHQRKVIKLPIKHQGYQKNNNHYHAVNNHQQHDNHHTTHRNQTAYRKPTKSVHHNLHKKFIIKSK